MGRGRNERRNIVIETEKERARTLILLEQWDAPDNEYRIGGEPLSTTTWHLNQVQLGPVCKTMADIERLVANIRTDLDSILVEARKKIAEEKAGER
jgi:hypothetical protein